MDSAQAQATVTAVVRVSLQDLLYSNPRAFYEIVTAARDRAHVLWGGADELQDLLLIQCVDDHGVPQIHDSVRQAILELVVGDDSEMRLS